MWDVIRKQALFMPSIHFSQNKKHVKEDGLVYGLSKILKKGGQPENANGKNK